MTDSDSQHQEHLPRMPSRSPVEPVIANISMHDYRALIQRYEAAAADPAQRDATTAAGHQQDFDRSTLANAIRAYALRLHTAMTTGNEILMAQVLPCMHRELTPPPPPPLLERDLSEDAAAAAAAAATIDSTATDATHATTTAAPAAKLTPRKRQAMEAFDFGDLGDGAEQPAAALSSSMSKLQGAEPSPARYQSPRKFARMDNAAAAAGGTPSPKSGRAKRSFGSSDASLGRVLQQLHHEHAAERQSLEGSAQHEGQEAAAQEEPPAVVQAANATIAHYQELDAHHQDRQAHHQELEAFNLSTLSGETFDSRSVPSSHIDSGIVSSSLAASPAVRRDFPRRPVAMLQQPLPGSTNNALLRGVANQAPLDLSPPVLSSTGSSRDRAVASPLATESSYAQSQGNLQAAVHHHPSLDFSPPILSEADASQRHAATPFPNNFSTPSSAQPAFSEAIILMSAPDNSEIVFVQDSLQRATPASSVSNHPNGTAGSVSAIDRLQQYQSLPSSLP
ncbi:hypothetical protein CAOG_07186 [Capsaspora owczarzaki ATCC 30864]|uniref:Uncharacterized protein n=1 Tax=Capsaspora owczarzaki (strain ATCC 30864) TaxID=595528 RepID=A0A0D2WWM0_CAPO3|nr:hypothetical protein CAOG_07186 [Capsaspora owczarzaki ATCC 30864]KJE96943.1 hypothetical protein CAOG_007186 [Capsaspora owczarzaki ATCC 30864]|eukprot:XP_004343910.1 hypothetical protein CAOG_07186 [Capsaspora owczarzaki ATCC 30864]